MSVVTTLIQKPFVQLILGWSRGSVFFGNAGSSAHKCTDISKVYIPANT